MQHVLVCDGVLILKKPLLLSWLISRLFAVRCLSVTRNQYYLPIEVFAELPRKPDKLFPINKVSSGVFYLPKRAPFVDYVCLLIVLI